MSTKQIAYLSSLSFLLLALLSVSPPLQAADRSDDSQQVATLLSQAKTQAFQLRREVSEMESFSRSKLAGASHTGKLTDIKTDTLRMAETLNRLNRARSTASISQQQAIEAVYPILRELAANIQATIHHLNENRQNIEWCVQNDPAYRELLISNLRLATEMAEAIADFVK